jgi:hypothetical protein
MLKRMGCKMKKKYTFWNKNSKKIVLAVLISMIWITTLTPMVLAVNTKISVTFDPNGTVILDVRPYTWAAGVVLAGQAKLSGAADFTVWNNGTVTMTIYLQTNDTADSAGMDYVAGAPGANQFALNTTGFTTSNTWIPVGAYSQAYHNLAGGSTSKTFGLRVQIGATLTTNYSTQRIEIRFQGTSI